MTEKKAKQVLRSLSRYWERELDDICEGGGIYLSDDVYVSALEYAAMQGFLSDEQKKQFDEAVRVLFPEDYDDDDDGDDEE